MRISEKKTISSVLVVYLKQVASRMVLSFQSEVRSRSQVSQVVWKMLTMYSSLPEGKNAVNQAIAKSSSMRENANSHKKISMQ